MCVMGQVTIRMIYKALQRDCGLIKRKGEEEVVYLHMSLV